MSKLAERYRARRSARAEAPSEYLDPPPPLTEDTLWRGLTRNGELRLLVARATSTVAQIAGTLAAGCRGAELLAELVVGGLLLRSALDPDSQLQVTVWSRGPAGRLYLDVWPSGRGLRASLERPVLHLPPGSSLLDGGQIEVLRVREGIAPYRSARSFGAETLSQLFEAHLLESDQIVAALRLDIRIEDDRVVHASGCLIQVTPEGTRDDLARLLGNLEALPPLGGAMTDADPDARIWVDHLLAGYRWDQSARESIAFVCRCSRERLLAILRALSEEEVAEMAAAARPIEITCEFCRARYEVHPDELRSAGVLTH